MEREQRQVLRVWGALPRTEAECEQADGVKDGAPQPGNLPYGEQRHPRPQRQILQRRGDERCGEGRGLRQREELPELGRRDAVLLEA